MKKRKGRLKRVLLWTIAIVFIIGVTGLFAVNYAINKALDAMVTGLEQELEAELNKEQKEVPSQMGKPATSANDIKPAVSQDAAKPATSSSPDEAGNVFTTTNSSSSSSTSTSKPTSRTNDNEPMKYSAEISLEKAELVKNKISVAEKATVAKILVSNLDTSDLRQLQEMASGGLKIDEKRQARTLLLEKLSPSEYDQLIEIAKKYGLSQGRKYSEIKNSK